MWIPYKSDELEPTILKSEVYNGQSRISIYHPGEISPYEIICGVYGVMFHTAFAESEEEAGRKYECMKIDLQTYIDGGMRDENFACNFVDKW